MRIFRFKDYDCEPIYIISNYLFNGIRPYIKSIKTKWNIEKCFGTCKQSLGLSKKSIQKYKYVN